MSVRLLVFTMKPFREIWREGNRKFVSLARVANVQSPLNQCASRRTGREMFSSEFGPRRLLQAIEPAFEVAQEGAPNTAPARLLTQSRV